MIKNIVFKFDVDDGKFAGTGHFKRCIALYNIIKKKYKNRFKYFFLFNNYSSSKKIIKKYVKKNLIIYNKNSISKLSFIKKETLVINDTPKKIDKYFLKYCKKNFVKNIVLMDHDKIDYPYKYTIINGIYFFKKKIPNASNIFQGFKYILLDKEYISIKKKKSNILKILITTGGTDNKHIVNKIYKCLKTIENVKFFIVIGPGFKKNNPILKENNKNILFIKNRKNLKNFFQKCNVSVTSGGISMFESICARNFTLVTELYKNQKYSIKKLKMLKMIYLIGKKNFINKKKLRNIILNLNNEKNINKIKIPKNFSLIDGRSAIRISKILFKILNKDVS